MLEGSLTINIFNYFLFSISFSHLFCLSSFRRSYLSVCVSTLVHLSVLLVFSVLLFFLSLLTGPTASGVLRLYHLNLRSGTTGTLTI